MKRYFLKILISATVILFAIHVFTLASYAQEAGVSTNEQIQSFYATDNDTPECEMIEDENGYKAIAREIEPYGVEPSALNKYQANGGSIISRSDLNNFVRLRIMETPSDIYDVKVCYKHYDDESSYHYNIYDKSTQYRESNAAQTLTTVILGEFDWAIADSYFVTVDTKHGIYNVTITQADLTNCIYLNMDSTYATVDMSVPFDLSAYDKYGINFIIMDEQGKCITDFYIKSKEMEDGYKIPSGRYNIQALGEGRDNSFSLLKTNYNLTPSTNIITFTDSDMAKVSLNQIERVGVEEPVTITGILFAHNNFDSMYFVAPSYSGSIPYVYVTKSAYNMLEFRAQRNYTEWVYLYSVHGIDTTEGPLAVDYDLSLKTEFIKPTGAIYGHDKLGEFSIKDSCGNKIIIYDENGRSSTLTVTLDSPAMTQTASFAYGCMWLYNPPESGVFSVEVKASGPIYVKRLTDSIYINRLDVPADDSEISAITPFAMNEGQEDHFHITVYNRGTNEWTATGGYKLCAVGGNDPFTTTLSYPLPSDVSMTEDVGYTFIIPVTAPQTRGVYITDWQMMKGDVPVGDIVTSEVIVHRTNNPYTAKPVGIASVTPDKTSPQMTGTKIRWNCNMTGGNDPVFYFKIFKGSTLVKSSTAYTSANYFDWTPTEAGTDYRALVYVKENGWASSTAVTKYSSYFTVTNPTPIVIKSLVANKTSPQMTGTAIRWTCSITGGAYPVYYFKIFKGSTLVESSAAYTTANYFDWTPAKAGTDYRAYVYVKENVSASSAAVTKFSSYFTVKTAPIAIKSLVPDRTSPQMVGTKVVWNCNITGGADPVYYFKIFKGSALIKSSTAYTSANNFEWTPTEAGTDYRAYVYVKENGAASSTAITRFSSYYTVTAPSPIVIESLVPDKTGKMLKGTTIRWTCNITGGAYPVYYFKIFKGSTLIKSSAAYAQENYFDWTPTVDGTDYRAYVYVKENISASSTAVTRVSGYCTISLADPIADITLASDPKSPQPAGTTIRWTCNITGGIDPVYFFEIDKGDSVITYSEDYSSKNYFDWVPTEPGSDYRALVYVKEGYDSDTSTAIGLMSDYFVVQPASVPIAITSVTTDKTSPQTVGTTIRWTCSITGGTNPVYYFKVFKGSTLVKSSTAYAAANYFDWTPTEAGADYRAYVYVKENGSASSTAVTKISGYYTITAAPAPISITSLDPDKPSPQATGTKIRWTCNITGGSNPVYSFKVFNGSTLLQSSPAFSTTNYIDWIPNEAGEKYRVMVYVKESGASSTTAVTKMSGYYTITAASAPIAITSLEPDKTSPQATGTKIRWTCSITVN